MSIKKLVVATSAILLMAAVFAAGGEPPAAGPVVDEVRVTDAGRPDKARNEHCLAHDPYPR